MSESKNKHEQIAPMVLESYQASLPEFAYAIADTASLIEKAKEDLYYRPNDVPSYIGEGGDKSVYAGLAGDMPVAIKFLKNYSDKTELTDQARPLIAGRGIPNLEQLLAVDTENGIMVTSLAPGKRVIDMASKELFKIKKVHLEQLKTTLNLMNQADLHPHNSGGILFDEETGFHFVDYTFDSEDMSFNKQPISTSQLDDFLHYALADHNKFSALMEGESQGMKVSEYAYTTTGLRAMRRNVLMRKAQKLEQKR